MNEAIPRRNIVLSAQEILLYEAVLDMIALARGHAPQDIMEKMKAHEDALRKILADTRG